MPKNMRKILFYFIFMLVSIYSYAQWNPNGNNVTTGKVIAGQGVTIGTENSGLTQFYMQLKPQDRANGEIVFRYAGADKKAMVRSEYFEDKGANLEFCTFPAGGSVVSRINITGAGMVGIGTREPLDKLDVRGGIRGTTLNLTGSMNGKDINANGIVRAREVKIELTGWSDFVFNEDYKLLSLSEVENHIKLHRHLPDIPTEKEVLDEGINIGEMQAKMLQKIEELTLYVIEQDKQNKELREQLVIQYQEIKTLKEKINKD